MRENVSLSTTLSKQTKKLLDSYCKERGIKISFFIEAAILEKLEDEMDVVIARERSGEERVPWKRQA